MKISQPKVELIQYVGNDLATVNAARVSFDKESTWENNKTDALTGEVFNHSPQLAAKDIKLINYLAKHNHWSPFAHNSLTFRIKAPIFVARQLVKHQVGGVWNEISRRYVDYEPEFYFPDVWHGKPTNAKQGASDEPLADQMGWTNDIKNQTKYALALYQAAIENGMAPEEARMVLPLNTMTEWWWTGSLMFFARVCKQRLDSHAQLATREVAALIASSIPSDFQHSWMALTQEGN